MRKTNRKYEVRPLGCDWALDIPLGDTTVVLYFNSRNNAELVKDVLEWEDNHPNEAAPYQPTLTPPNEWVSVEERLPEPTENPVLVYDCTGVNMAWYSYAMGWTHRTGLPGVEITHWMPLPEPPDRRPPEGEV